jgi:lysophospholipase L1-like esterase
MRRVLCYGDSNTWGSATVPRPDGRYGERERWPGVLQDALGADWNVIEEGLSARTTVHTDPGRGRLAERQPIPLPLPAQPSAARRGGADARAPTT